MKNQILPIARNFFKRFFDCKIPFFAGIFLKFYKHILKKTNKIKVILQQINQRTEYPRYRIEKIDVPKNKVLLYCHFSRGFLNTSIMEIIINPEIITNLPIKQAGLLGYFYGKFWQANKKYIDFFEQKKNREFSLRNSNSKFKINSLDRDGMITYFDINTNEIFKKYPVEIYRNERLIIHFDSIQACYLGILAGISDNKKPKNCLRKPILTIVK